MQHIYKGRFVDDTTFVDEFGNEYTLQTSDFGGDSDDNNKGNNQEGDSQSEQENNQSSDKQNSDSQQDSDGNSEGDDSNQSQDDDDLIEPEVGALFDDVMTGKQYRWNGNDFEEV